MIEAKEVCDLSFPIIEDPTKFIGNKVHVDGWNIGCVFILRKTENGLHTLETPKYHKIYTTNNKLRQLRGGSKR